MFSLTKRHEADCGGLKEITADNKRTRETRGKDLRTTHGIINRREKFERRFPPFALGVAEGIKSSVDAEDTEKGEQPEV
jgi:hypothetical protein